MPTKVACAIIEHEGKILVAQRGPSQRMTGKWEFPGGKLEPGESAETCIAREIFEELEIVILPIRELTPVTHTYEDFTIRLQPFICKWLSGNIKLHEHTAVKLLPPAELEKLDWSPADIEVLAAYQALNPKATE